jgi:hypothetical protein
MTEYILRCPQLVKGQSCPPCDELAALNQEISEAEVPLDTLNAKRPSIYGRMNHAHDPLTSKLPVELVSEIFTYFLPRDVAEAYGVCTLYHPGSGSRRTTPFLLGAVCVAWRAITWSTPELWSSISVNITGLNENHAKIVRGWLRRSRGCPLYINIYRTLGHTDNNDLEEEVLNSFGRCSNRWFYLALDIPLKYLRRTNVADAVMLNTLRIKTGRMYGTEMNLRMNPGIRNLYVDVLETGGLANVDWNKLRHLETTFHSINTCVETLWNASFLRFCTLRIFFDFPKSDIGSAILQHNHLFFLHIIDWTTYINTFLPMVQFTDLQYLIVSAYTGTACHINFVILADLLQRSRCSLRFLEIDVTSRELEGELELVQFLAQIPSLETLELRRGVYYGRVPISSDSVNHLLTTLSTMALTRGTEPSQLAFLPNLKNLIIKDMELSWNCVLDVILAHSSKVSNLETSPNVRPLRSVYLELCGQKYMSIELDMAQKLQHAIENSFANITILAGVYTSNYDDPILIDVLAKSLRPLEFES